MSEGPGFPPFHGFALHIKGRVYYVTRAQLRVAYSSPNWREAVMATGQNVRTLTQKEKRFGVWGMYDGDDSIYCILDHDLDPAKELEIMDREDASGKSEFFGPMGEFPFGPYGGWK
jgi:hypothetical protein